VDVDLGRAVEVLAAAEAIRERLGTPIPPVEAGDRDVVVDQLVRRLNVSNILRKLGAKRRVDAAGIAHKMGLIPVR